MGASSKQYAPPGKYKSKAHFFKNLDLSSILEPEGPEEASKFTGTKIIGTIGPSSRSVECLVEMLKEGMTAARIDLTWGPLEFHKKTLENLSIAMTKARRLCAIVVDILGREIMVRRQIEYGEDGWPKHGCPLKVTEGEQVILTTREDAVCEGTLLPVTYQDMHTMCEKGDLIYLGRYLVCGADVASLYLEVIEVNGQDIICEAKNTAELDGLTTVFHVERSDDTLLNLQSELPLFSDYDKECLVALAQKYEIDFLLLSYTRHGDDVKEARRFLDSIGLVNTKVLAKIETRQSLLNFTTILPEADGVVLSRGNLGLDVLPEKMALVQKTLIQSCNLVGKPSCITRVVDTMVNTPRPTRAEATDIANTVLDGVDSFLTGAETLRGIHPVEVVRTIARISRQAEMVFDFPSHYEHLMDTVMTMAKGVADEENPEEEMSPGSGTSPLSSSLDLPSMPQATLGRVKHNTSYSSLNAAVKAMGKFGHSSRSVVDLTAMKGKPNGVCYSGLPYLSKLESLASSAVRAADKVQADMIVVYTNTGKTAQLVAKYRPPMPIVTLVVPRLVSNGLSWTLEGRATARQCQLTRGLLPMLATPAPNGDAVLEAAIVGAAREGFVRPGGHVVCVQQVHEDFCVKIMSLDEMGVGIKKRASSHADLVAKLAAAQAAKRLAAAGGSRVNAPEGVLQDSDDEAEWDDFDPEAAISHLHLTASDAEEVLRSLRFSPLTSPGRLLGTAQYASMAASFTGYQNPSFTSPPSVRKPSK